MSDGVKFLCSHGGKILPCPTDRRLKYFGGETRLISVSPHATFQELMKKLTYQIDGEMVLKYQAVTEDLDALISVKSDEDLGHMFDEIHYLYQTKAITPRLRTFLFPAKNNVVVVPHALDQRYIDSLKHVSSSACSSPRSPHSFDREATYNDTMNMVKVQSSPTICNANIYIPHPNSDYVYQLHPQYAHQYAHHHPGYQDPTKPPIDSHRNFAPGRLVSARSVDQAGVMRYHVGPDSQHYYCGHFPDRRIDEKHWGRAMRSAPSSPRYGRG